MRKRRTLNVDGVGVARGEGRIRMESTDTREGSAGSWVKARHEIPQPPETNGCERGERGTRSRQDTADKKLQTRREGALLCFSPRRSTSFSVSATIPLSSPFFRIPSFATEITSIVSRDLRRGMGCGGMGYHGMGCHGMSWHAPVHGLS